MDNTLSCPLTRDLFEDPVTVPCCGQAFSRDALKQCFNADASHRCPMCRTELVNFNVDTAVINRTIRDIVEEFKQKSRVIETEINHHDDWIATYTGPVGSDYKFELVLNNVSKIIKPAMFVAICDVSGSMSGRSWNQVKKSLLHMLGVSQTNKKIHFCLICYDSTARIIDVATLNPNVPETLDRLFTSGGTNFEAAFNSLYQLLRANRNGFYDCAHVLFLTDGQHGTNMDRQLQMTNVFRETLNNNDTWNKPITINVMGIGQSCDKDFLEQVRTCGKIEGVFRFIDDNANADDLSIKINEVFDEISKSTTVETVLNGRNINMKISGGRGYYSEWCDAKATEEYLATDKLIIVNGMGIPSVIIESTYELHDKLFHEWQLHQLDVTASQILELASNPDPVYISVIKQKLINMPIQNDAKQFMMSQLKALVNRQVINVGMMRDMRYASRYGSTQTVQTVQTRLINNSAATLLGQQIVDDSHLIIERKNREKPLGHYLEKTREPSWSLLQKKIANLSSWPNRHGKDFAVTDEDIDQISHIDSNGNNALHLAAYKGQDGTLESIIKKMLEKQLNVAEFINKLNNADESPITIAIKARGFIRTIELLHQYGNTIQVNRIKYLINYCNDKTTPYADTIKFLQTVSSQSGQAQTYVANPLDSHISNRQIRNIWNTMLSNVTSESNAVTSNVAPPDHRYFLASLQRGLEMFDIANWYLNNASVFMKDIINNFDNVSNLDILSLAIPKKPDDPNTDSYLEIFKKLLDVDDNLINTRDSEDMTVLMKVTERGSLPHVKYVLEYYSKHNIDPIDKINEVNSLQNTALWIACAKKYPCIAEELLLNGADPNIQNAKGNTALYPICQVGPAKMAKLLIENGIDVTQKNANGDTSILIACRNGQTEVLEVLLPYCTKDFIDFRADIDGFNVMLASVEANRPTCIELLHKNGISVNTRTTVDNAILQNATCLHLAVYYGRVEAAEMLIKLGAEIDALGVGQYDSEIDIDDPRNQTNSITPLQLAIIQEEDSIIRLLISHGANKQLGVQYDTSGKYSDILRDPLIFTDLSKLNKYWHKYFNDIDATDENGNTELIRSVLKGHYAESKQLVEWGADKAKKNKFGLNAMMYANYMKLARFIELLGSCSVPVFKQHDKFRIVTHLGVVESILGYLNTTSRMNFSFTLDNGVVSLDNKKQVFITIQQMLREIPPNILNNVKLSVINELFEGCEIPTTDQCIIQLYKFIDLNNDLYKKYVQFYLLESIKHYPKFTGEVFVNLNDQRFVLGSSINITTPFSGCTLWKLAGDVNRKTGNIGIFKCANMHYIGGKEVVILPGMYKVSAVYHYDPICLGQSNIREHTFKIKEADHVGAIVTLFE